MTADEIKRLITAYEEAVSDDDAAMTAYISVGSGTARAQELLETLSRTNQRRASAKLAYLAACREMETP